MLSGMLQRHTAVLASLRHILLTGTADIGDETASLADPAHLSVSLSPTPPISASLFHVSQSFSPRLSKPQSHLRRACTCMGRAPFTSAC